MKKTPSWLRPFIIIWSSKTFRIMKCSLIILLFSVTCVLANDSYAQSARVSLDMKNVAVKDVLNEIEKTSEFYFLYSSRLIDVDRKVNIYAENQPIKDILNGLFANSNVDYVLIDRQIVLSPGEFISRAKTILQPITITGQVMDENGEPLPGVAVIVKGTTRGTITDVEGEYTIEVEDPSAVLVFSFVGYASREILVGEQREINISMELEVFGLGDVVVTGYGTRLKAEITGSISSVDAEDLDDLITTTTDVSETLKGTMSGITALESHTPGEAASIRIRGLGTINNNDPLWVVDGVPGGEVNPNNIESISVLKDASAQAIYGARAANGVILVTTKSGRKNQKPQVNVRVNYGVSKNVRSFDLLNTQEYGEYLWLMAANQGIVGYAHSLYGSGATPDIPEYIDPPRATTVDLSLYDDKMTNEDGDDTYFIVKANKEGTDWVEEITRNAPYQEYAMDITGGGEISSYSIMANFLEEEGILKYTGYKRYNLRPNITLNPAEWLEIGERVGIVYSEDWGSQTDNAESSVFSHCYRMQPIVPVYDVMGNFAGSRVPSTGNASNPVFRLWSSQYDQGKNLVASGNTYAQATFIEGLRLKTLFGFTYNVNDSRNINYVEKEAAERGTYDGLSESSSIGLQWNWTNTLEYSKTFANIHDLTLLAGTEAVSNERRWRSASRDEYFSRDPIYMQLDVGAQNQLNSGNTNDWKLFSVFGRADYVMADKYLFTATLRRDGSSRFGSENRYGTFPAISVGWRITEENFMAFSKNWLNNLKIRVGWGQSGNDQIGNYNSFTTFSSQYANRESNNSYYPITGSNTNSTAGFQSSAFGNPEVKWESTTTTNFGFDATLFRNLDLSVDIWKRVTDDMLYPKAIPAVVGIASTPSINIGTMNNTGFDVSLSYQGSLLNGDLRYNVGLNVSHYQNEITKLTGVEAEFIQGGNFRQMYYTRAETGTAFPEFYGYIVDGIFQTQAEADSHPPAFGEGGTYNEPGHFKFRDVNGDGVITADDRTYIGSPHPDFTGGLNLRLQYKDLSLTARFYTSYGNEMVNYVQRWISFNLFSGNRSTDVLYKSWGSPYLADNKDATLPKAEWDDAGSQVESTYFIEDASYLRLENLMISYDFANLFKGIGVFRSLRIFGQVTNVFTLTEYSGLDPEINAQGINKGIDAGAWPTPRRFLCGLTIGF
jgi:TonB-linked SusC/RagA family outer membrane protein